MCHGMLREGKHELQIALETGDRLDNLTRGGVGRCGEVWGGVGRCGEKWVGVGRCESVWVGVRRCGVGRCGGAVFGGGVWGGVRWGGGAALGAGPLMVRRGLSRAR